MVMMMFCFYPIFYVLYLFIPAHDKPIENAWAEPPKIIDQAKQSGSQSEASKQQSRLQSPVQQQNVPGAQSLLASQYPGKAVCSQLGKEGMGGNMRRRVINFISDIYMCVYV